MFYHINGGYMNRIAKIGTIAAIIAGLGIITALPITAHADGSNANQQQIVTYSNDDLIVSIEINGEKTFQVGDKTPIFLSTEAPSKVDLTFKKLGSTKTIVPFIDTAKETTIIVDGQTVKATQYTTTFNGTTATINWVKPGDLFANTKISYKDCEVVFDAYYKNQLAQNDATGLATIHTSMTQADFNSLQNADIKNAINIGNTPQGWTKTSETGINDALSDSQENERSLSYIYTNQEFPDTEYTLLIKLVNTPPATITTTDTQQPQDTTAQTTTSPELVQTGIEQTATAAIAIIATVSATYAITRKRNK